MIITVKTAEEWDEITRKLRKIIARQRKEIERKKMSDEEMAAYIVDRLDKYGGMIIVNREDALNEMMEIIMDANADNLETSEEGFIITTKPEDFVNVQKYLSDVLGEPEQAELTWLPNMPMDLDDEAYAKLEKLVDALDANDDVQKVFTAAA